MGDSRQKSAILLCDADGPPLFLQNLLQLSAFVMGRRRAVFIFDKPDHLREHPINSVECDGVCPYSAQIHNKVLKAGSYALYLLAFFVLLALIKNRQAHHWAGGSPRRDGTGIDSRPFVRLPSEISSRWREKWQNQKNLMTLR